MKLKYWIFQHYYIPLVCLLIIIVILLVLSGLNQFPIDFQTLLTILGGLFSLLYFLQKQQLEELNAFKELFIEFNHRYDSLNEKLNEIKRKDDTKELTDSEKDILYDYFNLCAEEYLFYQKGYI